MLNHMPRDLVAAQVVMSADERLVLVEVYAGHSDHIPEPDNHKTDIVQQRFLEQRVHKISTAEREQTRQDILGSGVLALEEVENNVLA